GLGGVPAIAIAGVEDPDAGIDLVGKAADEVAGGEPEDEAVFPQFEEGTDGIGAPPTEGTSVFPLERFGQDEESVDPVDQCQDSRGVEGHPQTVVPEPTAEGGTEDESQSEGGADEPEVGGAFFRRADVGDVGGGGGEIRPADPGEEAAQKKPRQGGGPGE